MDRPWPSPNGYFTKRLAEVWLRATLEDVTPAVIEAWRGSLAGLSNRSKNKLLIVLHGIFRRAQTVYGAASEPAGSDGEAPPALQRRHRGALAGGGVGTGAGGIL